MVNWCPDQGLSTIENAPEKARDVPQEYSRHDVIEDFNSAKMPYPEPRRCRMTTESWLRPGLTCPRFLYTF